MKKILVAAILCILYSCNKTSQDYQTAKDSVKIVDSINSVRLQHNKEVLNKPRFDVLSGDYILTHNMIPGAGNVHFEKVLDNHDEYQIEGEVKSGKNFFKIQGVVLRVSPKHFNFSGEVSESILANNQGKVDVTKVNKTFLTKDGGKTWKMQGMINSAGFLDDIYIKRK